LLRWFHGAGLGHAVNKSLVTGLDWYLWGWFELLFGSAMMLLRDY